MADAQLGAQWVQMALLGSSVLCCTLLVWDIIKRRQEEQSLREEIATEKRHRLAASASRGGRVVTVTKTQRFQESLSQGGAVKMTVEEEQMLENAAIAEQSMTKQEAIQELRQGPGRDGEDEQDGKDEQDGENKQDGQDEQGGEVFTATRREDSLSAVAASERSHRVREESYRSEMSTTLRSPWWFGEECRQQVDLEPDRQGLSDTCAEKLEELKNLGMECNVLSGSFDQWAVAYRDLEKEDAQDGQMSLQLLLRKKEALRAGWTMVRRLYYCIDVHLKNAASYQQFFHDVDEVNGQLLQLSSKLSDLTSEPEAELDQQQAKTALKNIEDALAEIQLLNVAIGELTQRSSTIAPVRLRTDPLKEPLPALSICSFKTGQLSVIEGEPMFLLDNQDQRLWKVRNSTGEEAEVPAVTILIPPPDSEACELATSLQSLVKETWQKHSKSLKERIAQLLKILLQDIIDKESLMAIISAEHLQSMLNSLETSEGILGRYFREYGDLLNMLTGVQTLVQNSTDEGQEEEGFDEIVTNVDRILELLLYYKILHGCFDEENTVGSSHDSEWDTLDDAQQVPDEAQQNPDDEGMEVSIQRETESAQVEGFTQSRQEVKQTFSIRGVIDPEDQREISMQEAVDKGIIDQDNGLYVNAVTGESILIPEAMGRGYIVVESTQTMRSREKTSSVGLVSVTISRETRPYTVKQVRDPRSDAVLGVTDAVEQGIFDPQRGVFRNPESDEEMSIENAIETGDLIVEYDSEGENTEPEVVTKHFVVTSVRDTTTGRRVKFHEAAEKGIINKETGEYTDQTTGDTRSLSDALRLGLVRARIIADPSQFETMLRERSHSNASLQSTDSRQSAAF